MKKVSILNLGSVIVDGVEGLTADTGCINLIYSFLLQEYGLDYYSFIKINQIDAELQEFVLKERNSIHVNIVYSALPTFSQLSSLERNKIRLDVIHQALIRVAAFDGKLDMASLARLKETILNKNFSFDLVYTSQVNRTDKKSKVEIIVRPYEDFFEFFCKVTKEDTELCFVPIFRGATVSLYLESFFSKIIWKRNEIIIHGKDEKLKIHVLLDSCEVYIENLTNYSKHPRFELYRANLTLEEKRIAYADWIHSLPPAVAANVRDSYN